MATMSRARMNKDRKAVPFTVADYRALSNGELHQFLCTVDPTMCGYPVIDETRETAIAMLKITHKK
jgi:hypothetical protein